MKTLIVTLVCGPLAFSPAISFVTPILKQAVEHQEATIRTYETQFPASEGAKVARHVWDPKRLAALEKIQALEALAESTDLTGLTFILQENKVTFVDPPTTP